jgi:hypothetical protein
LPHGSSKKTTRSPLAASETTAIGRQLGSPRTARAIVSGAITPVAMINKNAMPCNNAGPGVQSHRDQEERSRHEAGDRSSTASRISSQARWDGAPRHGPKLHRGRRSVPPGFARRSRSASRKPRRGATPDRTTGRRGPVVGPIVGASRSRSPTRQRRQEQLSQQGDRDPPSTGCERPSMQRAPDQPVNAHS